MFMSYEVMATFGISAILSFSVSAAVLLIIAAKRGYLRVGKRPNTLIQPIPALLEKKGQVGAPSSSPLGSTATHGSRAGAT